MSDFIKKNYLKLSLSLTIVLVFFNVYFPVCYLSSLIEAMLNGFSIISMAVIFWFGVLFEKQGKDNILTIIFAIVIGASTLDRFQIIEIRSWDFQGVVTKKFYSSNHLAETISVNNIKYEFIPLNIWERIRVGDKVLKESCSSYFIVNNIKIHFVDKHLLQSK